jgi:hypothetical protein
MSESQNGSAISNTNNKERNNRNQWLKMPSGDVLDEKNIEDMKKCFLLRTIKPFLIVGRLTGLIFITEYPWISRCLIVYVAIVFVWIWILFLKIAIIDFPSLESFAIGRRLALMCVCYIHQPINVLIIALLLGVFFMDTVDFDELLHSFQAAIQL